MDDKVELPDELQGIFEYEVNGAVKKKRIRTIEINGQPSKRIHLIITHSHIT